MKVYILVNYDCGYGSGGNYTILKTFMTNELATSYCLKNNYSTEDIIEEEVLELIEEKNMREITVYSIITIIDSSNPAHSCFKTFKNRELCVEYCLSNGHDANDIISMKVLESLREE